MEDYLHNKAQDIIADGMLQLPLSITIRDEAMFSNFCPVGNEQAIESVKRLASASGHGEQFIFLCGSCGVGRSHLLQAACHQADDRQKRAVYLPMQDFVNCRPQAVVEGLAAMDLVCVDDIQAIAQHDLWQEALFHLYNQIRDGGRALLVAGDALPKQLPFSLPDLVSRLQWGLVFQIHELKDSDKINVLQRRAASRGLALSKSAAEFMIRRCPRNLGALFTALDVLDRASLIAKRRLTIPFVKETLGL